MLEESKKVELNDKEIKQVSGGTQEWYDAVTQLLKEAGDRAWAALGYRNQLWKEINRAENATFARDRMHKIKRAMYTLEGTSKNSLSLEDYTFIHQKLSKSLKRTEENL